MKRRYRQHVNPLTLTSLVPRKPLVIPPGPEVEVELGCGDGLFMVQRAQRQPDTMFLGLDIRPEFLQPGLDRIAELALNNLQLETCNLSVDAPHLFPSSRVRTFWINFPDPWFKRRQQNRRWLDQACLDHLVVALRPGGRIVYQTDVWSPALEALALLESHPLLSNEAGEEFTFLKRRVTDVKTSRESACERERRHIWRLSFVHTSEGREQ